MLKKYRDFLYFVFFIHLFISILQYAEAIDLCARKNVPITEQFAELLTPTKGD